MARRSLLDTPISEMFKSVDGMAGSLALMAESLSMLRYITIGVIGTTYLAIVIYALVKCCVMMCTRRRSTREVDAMKLPQFEAGMTTSASTGMTDAEVNGFTMKERSRAPSMRSMPPSMHLLQA